uniref:Uncharacterized protein n=1 Tax=Caenorhabditis japonica TaxID=281687 RepID=A0A8R1DTR0_CAEJA
MYRVSHEQLFHFSLKTLNCHRSVAKNDANSAKLSSPLSSFIDVPNEPTEPVINVSFVTSDTYKNNQSFEKDVTSEIIDLSEIEGLESEPEKESSGEEENEQEQGNGNVIFYESSENKLEPPKFLFMPMAPEDELLPSAAPDASDVFETTPSSKTIVHAEPYSVVIIPLSEQEEGKIKSEDFPSSTELLIAFLISLSLFFYVCMCLYGFVDYKGIPVFWKVDLGVLPV